MGYNETQELIEAIATGVFDNGLSQIAEAVQARQKQTIHLLAKGDEVRFNALTRPKYLVGRIGTVDRVKQTTVVVEIEEAAGKYPAGCKITVPAALVEMA